MTANIPATPLATADTFLDPGAAMPAAEQALATPIPMLSMFKVGKVKTEITGRQPGAIAYRRTIGMGPFNKMSDGYLTVTPNGQGGSRIALHETRSYLVILGVSYLVMAALLIAMYFLFFRQSVPANPYAAYYQQMGVGMGMQVGPSTPYWLFGAIIGGGLALGFIAWEVMNVPKKTLQFFNQYAHGGAPFGGAGYPPPTGHPGYPPQPQPGFPPAQPAGFPPAPQTGGFPPPQPAAFPPAPPAGGFPPPPIAAPPPNLDKAPSAAPDPAGDKQLDQLAELLVAGVITAEDYAKATAAIAAKRG